MSALAAALVHSLWQGLPVVALVVASAPLLRGAGARGAAALAGLGALAALPAWTTWSILARGAAPRGAADAAASLPAVRAVTDAVGGGARVVLDATGLATGGLLLVWAAGAALLVGRLAAGVVGARRLVARGRPAPAPVARAVEDAARRLGVRRPVAVVATAGVDVPAVVGGRRPTLLVPHRARWRETLDPASLDVLIAHEVAHIRRRDWSANVAQSVVEALLWFHPGAWWLSARARREREFACDDLAARLGGRLRLARALAALEELRPRTVAPAPSAAQGPLLGRVARLAAGGATENHSFVRRPARLATCGLATACAAGALWIAVAVVPAAGLAASAPVTTLTARDDAGPFTLTFRGGRVIGATLDGAALPPARFRQTADSVHFLTPAGETSFGVRVKPDGGITWRSRPPARRSAGPRGSTS